MEFKITMRTRFPPFHAKSSRAVLIPSFADFKNGTGEDFLIPLKLGRVKSFLLEKKIMSA